MKCAANGNGKQPAKVRQSIESNEQDKEKEK